MKSKQSKLYPYQEKNRSKSKQNNNNDELLDSAILNNLNEDMNSPRENNNNFNQFSNINRNGNQIIDFKYNMNNEIYPSPHSNLNNIMINSENMQ